MLAIHQIQHPFQKVDTIKELFAEYAEELGEDLNFQKFEEELINPLKKYGPPKGALLLALWHNEPAGCVALQPVGDDGVCEMKRLFVKPDYREHGIGDDLIKKIVEIASEKGYKKMVLDTLERLKEATRLYEYNGFVNTSAYYNNPLPGVVYMEKELG